MKLDLLKASKIDWEQQQQAEASIKKMEDIFTNIEAEPTAIFKYDIMKFLKELNMEKWETFRFDKPLEIKFVLKIEEAFNANQHCFRYV